MTLGQPDAVQAVFLCRIGDGERFFKRFFLRPALTVVTFHHESNMHYYSPMASRRLHTADCTAGITSRANVSRFRAISCASPVYGDITTVSTPTC